MDEKARILIKKYLEKKEKRCTRTKNLDVHHKIRTGTNNITNAEVLCEPCHSATDSYGTEGPSPPDFTEATKKLARAIAKNRCQCTRTGGCH